MPEDRRSARRARLTGVRVTCESSSGVSQESDVSDLSRDGLFIASANPLAVGKRLSLEIRVAGEAAPWPALGRVVWNRDVGGGHDLPAGMAVKFIDVDESVVAAIDRLIETRERTEPGVGESDTIGAGREEPRREPPRREKTMIGVGIAAVTAPEAPRESAVPSPVAPDVSGRAVPAPMVRSLPSREKTMVGVGRAAVDSGPREPSLPIALVAKKPPSTRPPSAPSEEERVDRATSEARARRRRSGVPWLLLLLLVACGVAGYAFRDRLLPLWHLAVNAIVQRFH